MNNARSDFLKDFVDRMFEDCSGTQPPLEDQENVQKPEKQRKSIERQRKTKELHTTTIAKREDWGPGGPGDPLSLFYSFLVSEGFLGLPGGAAFQKNPQKSVQKRVPFGGGDSGW